MKILGTKTFAVLRYVVINGLFAACAYYGFFENVSGAENVALTMGWITAILGSISAVGFLVNEDKMNEDIANKLHERDYHFATPMSFDIMFDLVVTFVFIWAGHEVLGVFYAIHIYGGYKIRTAAENYTWAALKRKDEV